MGTPRRTVRDPRELRALAHPVRLDLLERLVTDGPALTATQAAALVGQSAASCSFHLRQLARYGFVEPAPPPAGGRGRERPWRLVGRGLTWSAADAASAEERAEFAAAGAEVSAMVLDRATAAAAAWMGTKDDEPAPWAGVGEVTTGVRYLTADQLRELVAAVQEAVEPFLGLGDGDEAPPPPAGARRVRVAFVAVPDDDGGGGGRRGGGADG